ncbi:hypothetical protein JK2ML_0527 [Mycobacterium leprae Kyoto-2]|uniref:Uncharacterized protein n=3 Tax=Mycobacterium leprae TaxID=1769 RepID=Q9CCR6_MYCLE|nr:hypothetical protein DIJ64_02845 [Mycobacterium leprae]OAR20214.1 hypothetical protein A8144_02890 [Mycobacterium leprae 3125609]OAX71662.1 hypothetical protein A3216_04490 [Mycobacterium leprae 7935681]CAR70620.1 hypothetical protein MLBr00527 [Mycobacterium leprae Br4923]BBC16614.1 hypothetical protein JK2ML_0527 [Mycobacterium leprae Kyoto-2]
MVYLENHGVKGHHRQPQRALHQASSSLINAYGYGIKLLCLCPGSIPATRTTRQSVVDLTSVSTGTATRTAMTNLAGNIEAAGKT